VVPEKVNGKTQSAPAAGPDTVVQVDDGEEVVVVVVVAGEVVEEVVVVIEVGVEVEVVEPQSLLVQTGFPSAPHTQVLQSTVYEVPGVQLLPSAPGQEEGQYPKYPGMWVPARVVLVEHQAWLLSWVVQEV